MSLDSVDTFRKKRQESLDYIRAATGLRPGYVLILGTSQNQLADEMDVRARIPYDQIPHFPLSTVENHAGQLLLGTLGGKEVVTMQGRFHYYEGYTMQQIVFPLRVLQGIGANTLLVSNASGGMNPNYRSGDIMLISDHINMLGDNPLIGPNDDELGPRFPDMSRPYTPHLIEIAEKIALEFNIKMHKGVYVALRGPMLETRAEYRFLRLIGADVVGMSTVPEVLAAVHMGMEVLGISVITDECLPDALEPVDIQRVLEAAARAEPNLTRVFVETLKRL
ncbi:MAG: purine-nucleoside phosphorylase [Balneolaceae bacterium]